MIRQFLLNYSGSVLSFIARNISFFIVVPWLAESNNEFAIYSVALSISVAMGYLDFGFLRSAQVFAAGVWRNKDLLEESKYVISGGGLYLLILFGFSFLIYLISFKPEFIINLLTETDVQFASSILSFTSINIIFLGLQRVCVIYLENRLMLYVYNISQAVMSLILIIGAYYLHESQSKFPIITYYMMIVMSNIVLFLYLTYKVLNVVGSYFLLAINNLSLSKTIHVMKPTALSSMSSSIAWLLFIEMDALFISKYFGVEYLAYFAPLVTLFGIQKFGSGMLWSPLNVLISEQKGKLLNLGKEIEVFLSLLFFLVLVGSFSLSIFADRFVASWLGSKYTGTGSLLMYTSLYFSLNIFSMLFVSVYTSNGKLRYIYFLSYFQLLLFWIPILIGIFSKVGLTLTMFVQLKLFVFIFSDLLCLYWLKRDYPNYGLSGRVFLAVLISLPVVFSLRYLVELLVMSDILWINLVTMLFGLVVLTSIFFGKFFVVYLRNNYGRKNI